MSFFSSIFKSNKNNNEKSSIKNPFDNLSQSLQSAKQNPEQRPMKRLLKPLGYAYKTFEIIEIIKKLEDSYQVNEQQLVDFLEEIPFTCNYSIIITKQGGKTERTLGQMYDINNPSFTNTCIGDHAHIIGLTNRCVISLSKNQYKQMQVLIKQSKSII